MRSAKQRLSLLWSSHPWVVLIVTMACFLVAVTVLGTWSRGDYLRRYPTHDYRLAAFSPPLNNILYYDSEHYYNIATSGYDASTPTSPARARIAFFPFYPMITHGLSVISGIPIDWSLLIIDWMSALTLVVVLYYWAIAELRHARIRDSAAPKFMLMGLVLFPTSFFLATGYTESLFMLLIAGSLLSYRQHRYALAGLLAALATATRVQGICLVIFFFLELISVRRRRIVLRQPIEYRKLIPLIMAPLGMLAFMVFQFITRGDALAFIHAQTIWGKFSSNYISNMFLHSDIRDVWYLAVYSFLCIATYKTLGWRWLLYCLAPFVLTLSAGSMMSINRYILSIFPLFLGLALFRHRISRPLLVGIGASSFLLLVTNIVFFYIGAWVG
ncbi:membrane protein of unknown function [Candidatus Saccharimonas aalborgensis]|uniref:Glycosyltransferase RgtA/B/C/D-like domain-containing protein n=1 Tax=Candidatus Saccharimonas aalborgensis TaxID=1332188 RepID=R4PNA8_9BACT|nr:membrane protein of unknown function [Candidatus Saccharimonas aalborgensis]